MIENYIKKGHANMWKGWEAAGGTLYLTKDHLIHVPHKLNVQNNEHTIELSNIESITLSNSLLLVPNGLTVHLKSGEKKKFVVNKRKAWKEEIEYEMR